SATRASASAMRAARRAPSPGLNDSATTASRSRSCLVQPRGGTGVGRPPCPVKTSGFDGCELGEALSGQRRAAQRSVFPVAQEVVGLDEGVELARALVDHGGFRVAHVALDRELVRITVGPVDLDRIERRLDGMVGGEPLRQARLTGVAQPLVLQPSGAPHEEPASLDPAGHGRKHLLDQLVTPDLLAERAPFRGVLDARVEARLGETHGPCRDRVATLIDGTHGDREALALLPETILERDADVIEGDRAGVPG